MKERSKSKTLALGLVALLVLSSSAVYIYLDELGKSLDNDDTVVMEGQVEKERKADPTTEKVRELIQQLDEASMLKHLEKITSVGAHMTARRIPYKLSNRPIIGKFFDLPIEKVAKYIYKEFESMGLQVEYQYWEQKPTLANLMEPSWHPGWFVGNNIVATLPGTDKNSDEIYVMGAHYDSVPQGPGANDDGSGVAAVLCAAKVMSKYSFNHTVKFVAFDGHEQLLLGSQAFTEEAVKNGDNIVAALTADMIGTAGPHYRETELLLITGDGQSQWVTELATNVNQRYSEELNFSILYDSAEGHTSDYLEFINDGYNSIFFAEATRDPNRHKPTDTVENMDIPYAAKIAKFVLATLAELAWDVV